MRITNFLKNYPITTIFIFFLLGGISIISVDSKIHATDTNNTPGCECEQFYCTKYQSLPIDSHLCGTKKPPNCTCLYKPTLTICPGKYHSFCTGTVVVSSGCSSTTRPCDENDCNPKCNTSPYSNCPDCNCGGCYVYKEKNGGYCEIVNDPAFGGYICADNCRYIIIKVI